MVNDLHDGDWSCSYRKREDGGSAHRKQFSYFLKLCIMSIIREEILTSESDG